MYITLAVPEGKNIKQKIVDEINQASNIKDKNVRDKVQTGLNKILGQLSDGYVYLWDGTDLEIYKYPLDDFIYHCGDSFVVPKDINLENSYGMVVVDNKECTIGELNGKNINVLWSGTSGVAGKHGKGGQSAARFERLRGEKLKQWYRRIGEVVKNFWN